MEAAGEKESAGAKLPTLSVAVCQLTSIDDVATNYQLIRSHLEELEASPPDLVCFPENSLYLRLQEGAAIPAIGIHDEVIRNLSQWSIEHQAAIHLGSIPLARGGKLYNSSLLLTPDGAVSDNYQKIHLFDVDVSGHKPVRESDAFAHGAEPAVFDIKGWKIGSSICYDLRFPELFLQYARMEVDVILIPSAFLVPTGQAHWEILTRARAIESQAYVLAAAQGGLHKGISGGTRSTWGHSVIIDPWGVVGAEVSENSETTILRAELSQERIQGVRRQIPMRNHRRLV